MERLFLMFLDHTQRRSTVGRDSSGRVISSSQRPLPDKTRHSKQTNIHAPVGFKPKISAGEQPAAARLLRSWVRNPPGAFPKCHFSMFIYFLLP